MEVVLIILVVVVAAMAVLGFFEVAQLGKAIRNISVQLEESKVQLSRQSQARNGHVRELIQLGAKNSEQQSRTDQLEELLEVRHSAAVRTFDQQGRMIAELNHRAAELRTPVAELQQATEQLREGLQSGQATSQTMDRELRREITSLQEEVASGNDRHQQAVQRQIQGAGEMAAARAAEAEIEAAEVKQEFASIQRRLTENDRVLGQRFAGLERDARGLERDTKWLDEKLNAIMGFVRRQLDDDSAAGRDLVLVGDIYAAQPAAVDVLPVFFDGLCRALSVDIIFCEPGKFSGGRFYLRWPASAGSEPRQQLRQLLGACTDGGNESVPGVHELRNLLVAVCQARSAAVQLGPLVAVCTADGCVSGLLSERDTGHLESLAADHATLLRRLDPDSQVDVMSLAGSFVL